MSNPFAAVETLLSALPGTVFSNATARIAGIFVDGMFDASYVNRLDMASSGPAFTCRSDALPSSVTHGTVVTVTYKGTTAAYTCAEVQPDGSGVTRLTLK